MRVGDTGAGKNKNKNMGEKEAYERCGDSISLGRLKRYVSAILYKNTKY